MPFDLRDIMSVFGKVFSVFGDILIDGVKLLDHLCTKGLDGPAKGIDASCKICGGRGYITIRSSGCWLNRIDIKHSSSVRLRNISHRRLALECSALVHCRIWDRGLFVPWWGVVEVNLFQMMVLKEGGKKGSVSQ